MKIRGNTVVFIVIIVVMLATLVSSFSMQYFQSKLLPLVVGGTVFSLAVIGLWQDISGRATAGRRKSREPQAQEQWQRYALNGAWIIGFAVGIFLVGFLVAVPVFVLLYMRWLGTRWRVAAIYAILTPLVLYGIFELAVEAQLYRGLVSGWLAY